MIYDSRNTDPAHRVHAVYALVLPTDRDRPALVLNRDYDAIGTMTRAEAYAFLINRAHARQITYVNPRFADAPWPPDWPADTTGEIHYFDAASAAVRTA